MADIILHHYPLSTYSEKVRLACGLKNVAYREVITPIAMPKPDLLPLTGGYRRAPVMQIGADNPCGDKPNQAEMNICIVGKLAKADAVLNQVYGELHGRLDALGRRNLVAAERAWITFRNRECDLRTGYDAEHLENNGTIAPLLVGECRLTLSEQRTADLRAQLKCPGGDLSCAP